MPAAPDRKTIWVLREGKPVSVTFRAGVSDGSLTEIAEPPRYPAFVSLRYQDGIDDEVRIVDGRLPVATGEMLPPAFVDGGGTPSEPPAATRIEIAISEATAAEIGVGVGDSLLGVLDGTDPILRTVLLRRTEASFEVVGIFSIADPGAEVWFEDRGLQRPAIGGTDQNPIAYATALAAPEAYSGLTSASVPFSFAWRFFVAPGLAELPPHDRPGRCDQGRRRRQSDRDGSRCREAGFAARDDEHGQQQADQRGCAGKQRRLPQLGSQQHQRRGAASARQLEVRSPAQDEHDADHPDRPGGQGKWADGRH